MHEDLTKLFETAMRLKGQSLEIDDLHGRLYADRTTQTFYDGVALASRFAGFREFHMWAGLRFASQRYAGIVRPVYPYLDCLAFDCFGTLFDVSGLPRESLKAYGEHVRRADFTPFEFGPEWYELPAHPDVERGMRELAAEGYTLVALSNGSVDLIGALADRAKIKFSQIIDLADIRAYKPNNLRAYEAVSQSTGCDPEVCGMVTANPTFGDIEGALTVGMQAFVIRHAPIMDLGQLAELLTG